MSVDTDQAKPLPEPSPHSPAHFVYLVRCSNGALYCGYTTDVDKRVAAHNAGKGAKYTRAHLPVTLLAFWSLSSKGDALRSERAIKHLSRARKIQLLEQTVQCQGALPNKNFSVKPPKGRPKTERKR